MLAYGWCGARQTPHLEPIQVFYSIFVRFLLSEYDIVPIWTRGRSVSEAAVSKQSISESTAAFAAQEDPMADGFVSPKGRTKGGGGLALQHNCIPAHHM